MHLNYTGRCDIINQNDTQSEAFIMEVKRFKPLIDKLFWIILIPTVILIISATLLSLFELGALLIMLGVDIFTLYFLVSSLFGYVELRENSIFIKFGLIMKKEIPYNKIRGITRARKFISDSMLSLKNALDHVNIKYNTFDMVSVSVIENDKFIRELELRIEKERCRKEF